MNPQLIDMSIGIYYNDSYISVIVELLPNLEKLSLGLLYDESEQNNITEEGFLKLARLTKLKHLKLWTNSEVISKLASTLVR